MIRIFFATHFNKLPVNSNNISLRIHPRPKLAYHAPIYGDASGHDHVLGRTKRCYSCPGQHFV
jgi:hypothetical protein